jgi:hypothetical protein
MARDTELALKLILHKHTQNLLIEQRDELRSLLLVMPEGMKAQRQIMKALKGIEDGIKDEN